MRRREDLTMPRRRRRLGIHYDPDAFGQFSESIARTLGTARFLLFHKDATYLMSWTGSSRSVAASNHATDCHSFRNGNNIACNKYIFLE